MRGTVASFEVERGWAVVRLDDGDELPFDIDRADRPIAVGMHGACDIGEDRDGKRRIVRMYFAAPAPIDDELSLTDLLVNLKRFGLAVGWRSVTQARLAGARAAAALQPGACELVYLYIVQDEERASAEGLLVWDWRFVNDTDNPFADLLALAGADSDEYFDRYDGQHLVLGRAGRETTRLDIGGGLAPLVAHVNSTLAHAKSDKRLGLFAFEGRAYVFYAGLAEHVATLTRLGIIEAPATPTRRSELSSAVSSLPPARRSEAHKGSGAPRVDQ